MSVPVAAPDPTAAPEASAGSLPALLLEQAAKRPRAVAVRAKELGRWQEMTWSEYATRVARIGSGLLTLGVGTGGRVAILSDNRIEWPLTDLAVQGIGAATVGIFATTAEGEARELLSRAAVTVAVVEDEEQLDKVLAVQDATQITRVVVIDTRGIRRLDDPVMSFEALEALGYGDTDDGGAPWRERVAGLAPVDVATVVFTPGTTGEPKGAMLTHGNLVAAAGAAAEAVGAHAGDELLSYLPPCEIAERLLTVGLAVHAGAVVNIGEGGASFANDLREVQPTLFLGVPRVWARMRATVDNGLRAAGRLKRAVYRSAQQRGGRAVGSALVSQPLRRHLGLGRVRVALSGTAPLPPALLEWLWSLGLRVREWYGLSESTGVATFAAADELRPGSVGRAAPGMEIALADDAEILVRGPTVFAGYLDDSEATGEALAPDGSLRTGDVGEFDSDGLLRLVGRKKEILLTSGGHRVAPRRLERRLEESPYITHAIVIGEGRPYLTAVVAIDADTVGEWAATQRLGYTTYRTLTERPEVHELVDGWIEEVNAELIEPDRIVRFALLPTELRLDDGTVTATFKLRRARLAERFANLIDAMYDERGEDEIEPGGAVS